jgi:hypothetical protein
MPRGTSASFSLRSFLSPLAAVSVGFGLDPRKLTRVRFIPRYLAQYFRFKRSGGLITHRYPVLADYHTQAGTARGHYFHQDLLVASLIHHNRPVRHIDIGSRVDGFVAHVAAFRKIEVMDVRKLDDTGHENISFLQADLMDKENAPENIADSVSCLHTIEHFGLGRYGDPIDPNGHIKGFNNLLRMLEHEGILYISFPIGKENAVHFNAHRVFHPTDILSWPHDGNQLELLRFDYVDDDGILHQNVDLRTQVLNVNHSCGIYTFRKL